MKLDTRPLLDEHLEIGTRIAGDDVSAVPAAINDMIAFSQKLKQLPEDQQREFFIDLAGQGGGFFPGITTKELLLDGILLAFEHYPRFDGDACADFSNLVRDFPEN